MKKIPITVGIVGHLDAIMTVTHRADIYEFFSALKIKYPESPICLISQLAIGADTLVVDVFMDFKSENDGDYRLITPIPYDIEFYEKTQFDTEEQLQKFRTLLSKAEKSFVLNKLSKKLQEKIKKNHKADISKINQYYREGGEFVADSSILLLVMWEGIDSNREGGSSNIASYKVTGSYKTYNSDQLFDQKGSYIDILCERAGNNIKDEKFRKYEETNHLEYILEKDQSIEKALDKIKELNSASNSNKRKLYKRSMNYLFPIDETASDGNSLVQSYYSLADVEAIKYQKKYYKTLKGMFIIALIFFILLEFLGESDILVSHFTEILIPCVISLVVVVLGLLKFPIIGGGHIRFIENRVLAEALRIQFYWKLLGKKYAVSSYILRIHKKEYDWIKHILLAIYGYTYNEVSSKNNIPKLKRYWIVSQKKFFKRKKKVVFRKEKQINRTTYLFLFFGFLFFIYIINDHSNIQSDNTIYSIFSIFGTVIFGVLAAIKGYYYKKGYDQIKSQYSLMFDIYKTSSDKLKKLDDKKDVKKIENIFFLTGKEALIENGNWYMIYKDKKTEME